MDTNKYINSAGLVNFGNTCFMNASIQLLMCARVLGGFMDFCSNYLTKSEIVKYTETWSDYMNNETKILGPRIIYHRYMVLNKNYVGFSQEDSHEFLTFTLDDIYEQIKISLNNSDLSPDKRQEVLDEVNKIYRLKFSQTVNYTNPSHPEFSKPSVSEVFENILSLPLESSCLTLEDCIKLYMDQTESDFTINYKLVNTPKYIFVGLKRFKCTQTYIQKIISPIDIPFETNCFDTNFIYELKGFVIHQGGVLGGHYYSYGLRKINGETKWFCYNDSNVCEVNLETISNESKQAYMLLYSRK